MSTTTTQSATCSHDADRFDVSHLDIPECAHCGHYRNPDSSIRGSYCTTACFHRAKGEAALGELQKTHTVCSTCYAVRKEIERPPQSWIDAHGEIAASAFIGIEHPTRHLKRSDGLLYCECGAVEHHGDHEFIKVVVLYETATNLLKRLEDLYADDKLAHPPDGVTLMQALRETECEWARAVGRSIYE